MTNSELYIDFTTKMNRLSGSSYLGLTEEEIEWYLNEAMYDFIYSILNRKRSRQGEDVKDTKEKIEDIEEILTRQQLVIFKDGEVYYVNLPPDFLHLENARIYVNSNCSVVKPKIAIRTVNYFTVELPSVETLTTWTVLASFGGGLTSIFSTTKIQPSPTPSELLYLLVHRVQEYVNKTGLVQCYWEHYDGKYFKNSFIFVDQYGEMVTPSSTVNNVLTEPGLYSDSKQIVLEAVETELVGLMIQPNELEDSVETNPFTKSIRKVPTAYFFNGKLELKLKDFTATSVELIYRRKPKVIDFKFKQSIELGSRSGNKFKICNEIVNLAVAKASARLGNENSQILNSLIT